LEDNDIIAHRDSDSSGSKLLALASSLFSGMDGIEIGGGIEIGSDDKVLSDINSDVNFQGITTSPRKTRSGKIVKY
jgi:hypothetical protein